MKTFLKTFVMTVVLVASLGSAAFAGGGAFDFLDPCIKARGDFAGQREAVRAHINAFEASISTMSATPEFRDAWMKVKREETRPYFDQTIAPNLREMGVTDFDKAFSFWFDAMIASVDPQQLTELIDRNYRELAKEEVARARSKTDADFDTAKNELDGSCKQDVGTQVLRVTLSPLSWIDGNFKAAKDEHNLVTQVFHALTGISPKDIAKYGMLGGPNSELRKLANAVAGGENSEVRKALRFLDPGNTDGGVLGGPNSFFRKPFG